MKLTGTILGISALVMLSSCSLLRQQESTAPATTDKPEQADTRHSQTPASRAEAASTPGEAAPTSDTAAEESPTGTAAAPATPPAPTAASAPGLRPASSAPTATVPEPAAVAPETAFPETEETAITAGQDYIPGGLRMRRFAPPEEAVSSSDDAEPAPNSVELHGFRSPSLKGGKLPMNINGKINQAQ